MRLNRATNEAKNFTRKDRPAETKVSFSPRSRALRHVAVMNKGQHHRDAEVDKPHHCQKFAALGDFKQI